MPHRGLAPSDPTEPLDHRMSPTAATISIRETLDLLDGQFRKLADGVAEGRYALWLGSGISFGRVDGLRQVVPRVLEFLRRKSDPCASPCRFREALLRALELASPSDQERARFQFDQPFPTWPDADSISRRLISRYSDLLDVTVDGEDDDFLLWEAVRVTTTYADPTVSPDVEHLCIALLMLEGVASEVATANWDGLIERAVHELSGHDNAVAVCVRPTDLRNAELRARLYKFHGCAILAARNPAEYRPLLVARQSQISGWVARHENAALVQHLVGIIATRPTLMMGLSVQDANIQALFAHAEDRMAWQWPGERPAFVVSEDELGVGQVAMLKNVYRAAYSASTRDSIFESAVLRAYAKPLLVALTLWVLCAKLQELVTLVPGSLPEAERERLKAGIFALRNELSTSADADKLAFIRTLVEQSSRALAIFRDGSLPGVASTYTPLLPIPLQKMPTEAALQHSGARELGVLLGLLGMGVQKGVWKIMKADGSSPSKGTIRVGTVAGERRFLLVENSFPALQLRYNGDVTDDDADAVVVHSRRRVPPMTRSPRSAPGRTGRPQLRELSISDLLEKAGTADELFQLFREEIAA